MFALCYRRVVYLMNVLNRCKFYTQLEVVRDIAMFYLASFSATKLWSKGWNDVEDVTSRYQYWSFKSCVIESEFATQVRRWSIKCNITNNFKLPMCMIRVQTVATSYHYLLWQFKTVKLIWRRLECLSPTQLQHVTVKRYSQCRTTIHSS